MSVLSRNNVLPTNKISSAVEQSLMKKLNKRKIKWIVKESERRELGAWTIAKQQKISKQHAYRVARKFKNNEPELKKCGRKSKPISRDERERVLQAYKEIRSSAVMLEQYLDEKGIHIGHNRIHKILLEAKLAKEEDRKKRRRSWVRYERKHSNSLWHTDWTEYKGKQCIIYIDDASRFIVSHGEFNNANTENSLKVFKEGLKRGIPRQVMSDHGTQFEETFTEGLKEVGSKHIKARVKHPQSNGKAERVFQTIKKLWKELGSLDKVIEFYNYKKPHMSLTNGKLRTPYQAFLAKKRKE
jgi:putative transposase